MRHIVRTAALCSAALLLQWLFFGRLWILGTFPDVVLLFVAWVALRRGRLSGSTAGFFTGFALDAIYGSWGIQMFVKAVTGFLVGLLASQERESFFRYPHQAFVGALVVALVHNGMLVLLLSLQSGSRTANLVTELWIGCALYTAIVALIAAMFNRR